MNENNKIAILDTLKDVFDSYPRAWKDYHTLGSVVLDCTELVYETACGLRFSRGFTRSCRTIEEILRKEKQADLIQDFHAMVDFIDHVRGVAIATANHIDDVIDITSRFLQAMEEIEYPK